MDLLDDALEAGWALRRAAGVLELGEVRAHRWFARRARGQLVDRAPGGAALHGLLAEEVEQILALFEEWGETDRSHRKLAHRGSYLGRLWVSPSSVRRVLSLADKHFRPLRSQVSRGVVSSPTGSSTPRTRSGSTTSRTFRERRWRS